MSRGSKDSCDLSGGAAPSASFGSTSETLLERLKAGDAAGWRRFVALYTPLLMHWCHQGGLRGQAVEDVIQEVFVTVVSKIGDFGQRWHRGSFRAWLRNITGYKRLAYYRATGKVPWTVGGSAGQALLDAAAAPEDEPDEATERAILCRRILELTRAEFDPQTWEAAYRVIAEGQRAADVAAALGITANAVYIAKSRVLARGRQIAQEFVD